MRRILALTLAAVLAIGGTALAAGGKGRPSPDTSSQSQVQSLGAAADAGPRNQYLAIGVSGRGFFNSGSTGEATGDQYAISYLWPDYQGTGFTTLLVDQSSFVLGKESSLTSGPAALDPLTNQTVWEAAGIRVTQTLQIVQSAATGRPDTGMYMYTATNVDQAEHSVGLRIMIDTMLGDNDGAPFRVPGVGAVTAETDFLGDQVPQYWQAFHSLENPDVMAQGTLAGGGATPPDRFTIANWYGIFLSRWDYAITPGRLATEDSAVALWWNPVTLKPGESRTWVTYYGLGAVSGSGVLTVTGPAALTAEEGSWAPDPFTVTAYVTNHTPLPMADVPVTLSLPPGLALAGEGTAVRLIPSIAAGSTELVSWRVSPLAAGQHTYTAAALGLEQSRSVLVPELEISFGTLCSLAREQARTAGLATSLCAKLQAAEAARSRGQEQTASQLLRAFIQEVEALKGKGLPADLAEQLTSGALRLMR